MHSLNSIWQQAQTGDRLGAKKELARFLRERPDHVQGWLLMATLLDESAQQAECYRRVLHLDPGNHGAATALQQIASSAILPQESVSVVTLPQSSSVQIPELFDYTTEGEVDEERLAALIREDLVKYVVRELGSDADRNAVICHVCETGEMSWPAAEAFVARVALEHEHEIVKRQSPLLLVISVATLIGGVFLIFAIVSGFLFFNLRHRLDIVYYGIVTGLGMIGGGLIGLVRTLKSLREAGD